MTEDEFIAALAAVPCKWKLHDSGLAMSVKRIRNTDLCCPIVAVARSLGHEIGSRLDYCAAGDAIGLSPDLRRYVAFAADQKWSGPCPSDVGDRMLRLRERLLAATGLSD